MATKYLVDTSVWIDALQGRDPALGGQLSKMVRSRQAVVCGQVLAELVQGIRGVKGQRELLNQFEGLDFLDADRNAWVEAGQLSSVAAGLGRTVPLGDCLIAVLSRRNKCSVLTRDKDFSYLPGVAFELI